jgi:hypothetical protein
MRICVVYAVFALLNLASTPAERERFAGTWEIKFNGAVICTIALETGEKISGTTSGCSINVDNDGNLIEPDSPPEPAEPEPILNPKIDGSILSFEIRDEEDEHPTRMQIELKGEGRAELRIVDAPVKVKPIPLTKR